MMPPHFLFPCEPEKKEEEKEGKKQKRKEEKEKKEEEENKKKGKVLSEKEKKEKKEKEDQEREKALREKILNVGPKNMLAGLGDEEASFSWNHSAYQDDDTWLVWMEMFVLWKNKVARQKDKPVILLLDGHGLQALWTAAKHGVVVL
jgi:hypothetical protein